MCKRINFSTISYAIILLLCYTWGTQGVAYMSHTNSILGPSDHREAYFNGSSYVRMHTTISLLKQTGLSFRTCIGGELFSQQYKENIISLSVNNSGLVFLISTSIKRQYETLLPAHLLDNRWHNVLLEYRLGNLTLSVDGQTQILANSSFNNEFLTYPGLLDEGAILIIGKQYSGCILEGPSLVFQPNYINPHATYFGPCPLPTNSCVPRFETTTKRMQDDFCSNEPCMRHGKCISRSDRYECHCTARYTGNNCEIDNGSPCQRSSPVCLNGGTCIEDKTGDYTCQCLQEYIGKHCETEIKIHPLCDPDPCMNNGTCRVVPGSNSPDCVCQTGFKGPKCEIDVNECLMNPCQNGGTCVDGPNNYTCYCQHTGYEGKNCEININECRENPCVNNGVCFDTYGSYVCQCQEGYGGQNCEQNLNECLSMPCQNGGVCIDRNGGYECQCPPRFSGRHCELSSCDGTTCSPYATCIDTANGQKCICKPGFTGSYPNCTTLIDSKSSCQCQNGGTCTQYGNTFNCTCAKGYTGKNCQTNIDECISMPCLNGGTCIDKINGFVCNCTEDYMGVICERPYEVCEMKPCKNKGICSSTGNKKEFSCDCLPGFDGPTCEININECEHVTCPEGRICVDLINKYECRCPEGYTGDDCSILANPCSNVFCQNGGTCVVHGYTASCNCEEGFKGKFCEEDRKVIDECSVLPPPCVHGICIKLNKPGPTGKYFRCYCEPGYSGDLCDVDVDECLSQPCKHNATCINKINNFECACMPGYTGKDCSININECEPMPCMAGSTCIDEIASFTCICQPGMTGRLCDINIDDCDPQPCQNGGQCIDGLNSYTCNCSDTGYNGDHCENNIDDCVSNPCKNGAECLDGIKDYSCGCHPGYTGKNCEIDVNECESSPCQHGGTCLQRSNISLYDSQYYSAQGLFNFTLPSIFSSPFNFKNASGYECICRQGLLGRDCEVNINECESSPCHGGQCIDKIGGYICECDEGYEGEHCEHDIDECLKYKPCVHGTCMDRRANYYCDCQPNYGGKNCSVELMGCQQNPCLNGGTCKPYLENEINHKYNCSCPNGFHGDTCEKVTTMSLKGTSYIVVNTSRDEGYDIQFRFKTTLGDGLLAIGKGPTYYILELVHGRLNLHSSLLNKWEGVFIGSNLNDSNWQKVFVAINSSHLVLAANEEQTIYPINLNEGANASHTSFPTTYLGGTIAELRRLTHVEPPSFVGCTEDVIINGEWVLPQNTSWMSLVDIDIGCHRTPQCNPNPCHSGGRCTDKWRTFNCTCERPFLGHTCQYNYTAATFGYENITNSLVTVNAFESARRAVRYFVDISMFIRTRQSTGQIFYIGSSLTPPSQNDDTNISAQLEGGELLVKILFNGTPESYSVGGYKLDNGYNHLIEVTRNLTFVQVKLNGTEYFRKTISATGSLDAQVLYLGGLPETVRSVRQTTNNGRLDTTTSSGSAALISPSTVNFKGIIQDVQISSGRLESQKMVVEFFPLRVNDVKIPASFGNVSYDDSTLKSGVVSDDSCANNPCRNGTCMVTWNDFVCTCSRGYKGKTCSDLEFCQLNECPKGSTCRNLEDNNNNNNNNGYECLANTTFNGKNNALTYNYTSSTAGPIHTIYNTMEINFRTKYGGTLLYAQNDEDYFFIYIYKNEVTVQWTILGHPESHRFSKEKMEDTWNTLYFVIKDRVLYGGFKDQVLDESANFVANDFNSTSFTILFMKGTVYLGGSNKKSYEFLQLHEKYEKYNASSYITNNSVTEATIDIPMNALQTEIPFKNKAKDKYKGCLGEIRIGDLLLPYFPIHQIYGPNYTEMNYFSLLPSSDPTVGCKLCYEEDCLNKGHCSDPENNYQCHCAPGYEAEDCSVNIDECINNQCKNNSTCEDRIANYTCNCAPGYEGWLCDIEIDECRSNPCRNGGICTDLLANYNCTCTEDFVGHQCEARRLVTCDDNPCRNGSTCHDVPDPKTGNNFTCVCTKGMVGALCDTPFCVEEPCKHGYCNLTTGTPFCQCERGYKGVYCEENINDCILPTGDSPCQNGGICIDEVDRYTCNCTNSGYQGLICEIDVNECETEYICGKEGECVNFPGSYKCNCPAGMCGMYCALPDPCVAEPCVHGTCISNCKLDANFTCDCKDGFSGVFCNETMVAESANSGAINIVLIAVPIVAILLLGGAAGLAILIAMARTKRATRGTYSPSAQEFCNPRVELDHVLKPPPEERLI